MDNKKFSSLSVSLQFSTVWIKSHLLIENNIGKAMNALNEVYNIFLGQKLTILEFHLRFFPEAKLWALVTSLRSQIFAEYFCFYDMYVIKTDPKRMLLFNNCYKTVSDHFFAICIFIFHKTEVQTAILRCWTGLFHNWFKPQWSWAVVQREKKYMAYDLHPVLIPYLVSQNS